MTHYNQISEIVKRLPAFLESQHLQPVSFNSIDMKEVQQNNMFTFSVFNHLFGEYVDQTRPDQTRLSFITQILTINLSITRRTERE